MTPNEYPYLALTAVFFVLWLVEAIRHTIEARNARKERQQLYNRLQAGGLREYASLKDVVESEPVKVPVPVVASEEFEYQPDYGETPTEVQMNTSLESLRSRGNGS